MSWSVPRAGLQTFPSWPSSLLVSPEFLLSKEIGLPPAKELFPGP